MGTSTEGPNPRNRRRSVLLGGLAVVLLLAVIVFSLLTPRVSDQAGRLEMVMTDGPDEYSFVLEWETAPPSFMSYNCSIVITVQRKVRATGFTDFGTYFEGGYKSEPCTLERIANKVWRLCRFGICESTPSWHEEVQEYFLTELSRYSSQPITIHFPPLETFHLLASEGVMIIDWKTTADLCQTSVSFASRPVIDIERIQGASSGPCTAESVVDQLEKAKSDLNSSAPRWVRGLLDQAITELSR